MQRFRLSYILATLIVCGSTSASFAQSLDGSWLKLNVRANGLSVRLSDDTSRKNETFRGVCYMFVEYDASNDTYTGNTACEIAKKVWSQTTGEVTFTRYSDEGGYAFDTYANFTNRQGQVIEGNGTHLLVPIYSRRGILNKLKLQAYGAADGNSSLKPGVTSFAGGYTVAGARVVDKRVPTAVKDILDPAGPPPPPPSSGGLANEILALVNAERAAGARCGSKRRPPVGPLSLDSSLNDAANVHAVDMATENFFDHIGSDDSDPFDRIAAAGFTGRMAR